MKSHPRPRRARIAGGLSLALLVAWQGSALAQPYPAKPITFVLTVPPGSIDMAGRVYAEEASKGLGQKIVVTNIPGSGGIQAALTVRKAPADGYTLFMGTGTTMATLGVVRSNVPFDSQKDFRPVTLLFSVPSYVTTHTGNPFKTIAELRDYALKNPGKVTYGSQGIASPGHFQGAMLESALGVQMLHVPYKGGIPMILDMVAQRVDIGMNTWSATKPHERAGKLRFLAVTSLERRPEEPDVPTLAELGIRGVEHDSWSGVFVHVQTPDAIVDRLNREFVRASRTPEVQKRLASEGFQVRAGTPEDLRKHLADEIANVRAAAKKFNIRSD